MHSPSIPIPSSTPYSALPLLCSLNTLCTLGAMCFGWVAGWGAGILPPGLPGPVPTSTFCPSIIVNSAPFHKYPGVDRVFHVWSKASPNIPASGKHTLPPPRCHPFTHWVPRELLRHGSSDVIFSAMPPQTLTDPVPWSLLLVSCMACSPDCDELAGGVHVRYRNLLLTPNLWRWGPPRCPGAQFE